MGGWPGNASSRDSSETRARRRMRPPRVVVDASCRSRRLYAAGAASRRCVAPAERGAAEPGPDASQERSDRRPGAGSVGAQPRSRRQPGGGAASSPDASQERSDRRPELGVGAKPGLPRPRSGTGKRVPEGIPLGGHGRLLAGGWGRDVGVAWLWPGRQTGGACPSRAAAPKGGSVGPGGSPHKPVGRCSCPTLVGRREGLARQGGLRSKPT